MWSSCTFGEGGVSVEGAGRADVGDRFVVAANGVELEVIVVQTESTSRGDTRWRAVDVASYERIWGRPMADGGEA